MIKICHVCLQFFTRRYVRLYLIAIISTYILVVTGVDWWYFEFVMAHIPKHFVSIVDVLGYIIALFLPIGLYTVAKITKNHSLKLLSYATFYATILGFTLSTLIKVFTGRVSPPDDSIIPIDNSHMFQFGFMREQIIGGWPSSHATIMFALAMTIATLYPRSWTIKIIVFTVATFIGLGVTFGFHWLSEFIAGSCLGLVIGNIVGTSFLQKKIMFL